MGEHNPYEVLGVSEDDSFEAIQASKVSLIAQCAQDEALVETIEAAYDAIIMDRLRLRQEGKIKVPEGIRFPEKTYTPPQETKPATKGNSRQWLQGFLDRPGREALVWPLGGALVLGAASFSNPLDQSWLSLILALGLAGSVYWLNRKEKRFGRSLLLGFGSLVVGVWGGGLLVSALGSQGLLLPINPSQAVTLVTLLVFWAVSSFLR